MKNKWSKFCAAALICALSAGGLFGCGNGSAETAGSTGAENSAASPASQAPSAAEGSQAAPSAAAGPGNPTLPLTDEPTELTIFWQWYSAAAKSMKSYEENHVWQEAAKRTNVSLKFISPPLGQQKEQFNLMVASGDFPDLIMNDGVEYPGGGDKAINDGNYLRLNDFIDQHAPNFKALIESNPEFMKGVKTDSGNIWGFPMIESTQQEPWLGLVVRQDWLDSLGLGTPVTFDDWYTMLKRFKEEKGAASPYYLAKTGVESDESMIAGFGVGQKFYQENGKVLYGPIQPGYRDYLETMSRWYAEGLIDADFASRDESQKEHLLITDQTGACNDGFWMLDVYKAKAQDPNFRLVAVPTPVKKAGDVAHLRQTNDYVRGFQTAVSGDCKNPALAVRFLDYLYSPDGFMLTNYGIEGETYQMVDGKPQYTDVIANNPDGLSVAEALQKFALHSGPMNRVQDREMISISDDEIQAGSIWATAQDDGVISPLVTMTSEEGERYAVIMGDINTLVDEMRVKTIMGLEPIENFDAFVDQVKKMGIDEAIEIQQAALDRYNVR